MQKDILRRKKKSSRIWATKSQGRRGGEKHFNNDIKLLCKIRNCWKCLQLQIACIMSTSENTVGDWISCPLCFLIVYQQLQPLALFSKCWVRSLLLLHSLCSHFSLANLTKSIRSPICINVPWESKCWQLKRSCYPGDNILTVGKAVVAWEKIREKGGVSLDGTRNETCNRGLV